MARKPTLKSPRLTVILGDPDNEDSWVEHEVQTRGNDLEMVEEYFARRKKDMSSYPMKAQRLLGYYALTRTSVIPGDMSPEEYAGVHVETGTLDVEEVGPTQQGPDTD